MGIREWVIPSSRRRCGRLAIGNRVLTSRTSLIFQSIPLTRRGETYGDMHAMNHYESKANQSTIKVARHAFLDCLRSLDSRLARANADASAQQPCSSSTYCSFACFESGVANAISFRSLLLLGPGALFRVVIYKHNLRSTFPFLSC